MSTATDIVSQLSALQHADSFFPSGAISFSQGLETLYADREVKDAETLATFVEGQLLYRWASMEAPAMVLAPARTGALVLAGPAGGPQQKACAKALWPVV
jgi:urease accessory protein